MKVIIAKIAQQEFNDAKDFYEIEQPGLGLRFETEIKKSILRIKKHPSAWPIEYNEVHRYLIHKFPYKILYSIQNKIIIILAFAHQHRKPEYWIDRLKQ
ncbi:MAG: type II toxin-antitoxin system RelE/ParE family toxin [Actinobacteria bacterium]|nr:type II toxin-antitoxin system RelE/ParE family toxin [Actinomycetota bacterium]